MEQPGIHSRHRDKNGEISRKHGNTLVSSLRKIYGETFASDFAPHTKLSEVLTETGDRSLTELHLARLHKDHETGHLLQKIVNAEG